MCVLLQEPWDEEELSSYQIMTAVQQEALRPQLPPLDQLPGQVGCVCGCVGGGCVCGGVEVVCVGVGGGSRKRLHSSCMCAGALSKEIGRGVCEDTCQGMSRAAQRHVWGVTRATDPALLPMLSACGCLFCLCSMSKHECRLAPQQQCLPTST